MDLITRLAMAQREIGVAACQPPSPKGYTFSVFNLLPKIFERSGRLRKGSITGFSTVLVEGDDLRLPRKIASARGCDERQTLRMPACRRRWRFRHHKQL